MRVLIVCLFAVLCYGQVPTPIQPGESIQAKVDAGVEGAVFLLKAGVHRQQAVRPKAGNTFVGETGAVMNGAKVLTGWIKAGNYWYVTGQTQRGQQIGICDDAFPRCRYPEQLFIGDVRLTHVDALSKVVPGKWFFDYAASRIYMGDDPSGKTVETSVTTFAFYGSSSNVRIKNLIIEKYATLAQHGAIHPKDGTIGANGQGWTVEDCDVRWNAGAGIAVAPGLRVSRSKVRHNGQIGFSGEFQRTVNNIIIEDTEISFNNLAGFQGGWESGGAKFLHVEDLILRRNHVHDNRGPGLWCDTDNIRVLYDGNLIENNSGIGIFHEVSYDATIRNNVIRNNGQGWDVWLWGAQILIAASPNVLVEGNQITVAAGAGDGVTLIQQNRGSGKHGPYLITNTRVVGNTITFLGKVGTHGAGADYAAGSAALFGGTNKFDGNTYYVADKGAPYFAWGGNAALMWAGMQAAKQELTGRLLTLGEVPTGPPPPDPGMVTISAVELEALRADKTRLDWIEQRLGWLGVAVGKFRPMVDSARQ